ncbi:MAG: sulfatase-like hydrolase/transferase [Rhodospirillaceae bacterium]|nr:sulfatase-like hydrolase/transferase [Rhodospirillaceae bacterium]
MARKFLLITTDQQRFDALGCNGGKFAATPNIDKLAAAGLNFTQARNQSTVCMPARSTILTGQSIRRHGVTSNGIPLPDDAPSLSHHMKSKGYKTALLGKAHLEPHAGTTFFENLAANEGNIGPHRGFDRMELAGHSGRIARSTFHYPKWLNEHHADEVEGFHEYAVQGTPSARPGGDTDAPQVAHNPIPKDLYHTHWTAERTKAWLDTLDDADDWFCWMSFPDPHHPWDPPMEAAQKFDWRDLPLPDAYPGSVEKCLEVLDGKPRHWREWYLGENQFAFEVPPAFVPANLSADAIREVNAKVHAENELIDEAVGSVMDYLDARGWNNDTDVIYTTDHGEFQGDFGMLFKGPYHVEGLMHVPFIWRPAPSAGIAPGAVNDPVGHLDIAPTIAAATGEVPGWMQGAPLPTVSVDSDRDGTTTEWIDSWDGNAITLRTFVQGGRYVITEYGATNVYDGTEGELYDLAEDPRQWRNLWDEPAHTGLKSGLLAALRDNLPAGRETPLEKIASV